MGDFMSKINDLLRGVAGRLDWLPGFLSRLTLGFIFVQTGWGKLQNLDKVTQFFAQLGIPAPALQAPFVAGVELVCGALVLVGLFTRLAAVPLICTMAVAILTAKRESLSAVSDFFSLSEYLLIVLLVWLVVKGAGAVSLDAILCRKGSSPQRG